mmetsp:Transcript_39157/g.77020  ORF Transcript_39157/g.77020 Transcript_39157/m.77020 type:complete len:208 (-) Transcript_39157:1883-2506(-)
MWMYVLYIFSLVYKTPTLLQPHTAAPQPARCTQFPEDACSGWTWQIPLLLQLLTSLQTTKNQVCCFILPKKRNSTYHFTYNYENIYHFVPQNTINQVCCFPLSKTIYHFILQKTRCHVILPKTRCHITLPKNFHSTKKQGTESVASYDQKQGSISFHKKKGTSSLYQNNESSLLLHITQKKESNIPFYSTKNKSILKSKNQSVVPQP